MDTNVFSYLYSGIGWFMIKIYAMGWMLVPAIFLAGATVFALRMVPISFSRRRWLLVAAGCLLLSASFFCDKQCIALNTEYTGWLRFIFSAAGSGLLIPGLWGIGNTMLRLRRTGAVRRESEQRYRSLFNSASDEIFLTDLSGAITEVNQGACDRLVYSYAELTAKNISDLHPDHQPLDIKKVLTKIETGSPYQFESQYQTSDGVCFPVEIKSKMIAINDSYHIIWTAHDISDRKEMEKRIVGVVIETEERERERFARDLHDGLGPLLSAIKLYVGELGADEIEKTERDELLRYSNELIDEAISSTRTISNNIAPHLISKYGLIKAIESYIKKINLTHTISIDFNAVNTQPDYNRTIDLIHFRAVTELINNTIKHAGADNIRISMEEADGQLVLLYADNGRGFDPDEALRRSPEGIGLKNILSRVQSVKGTITFDNHAANGVLIRIVTPAELTV